MVGLAQKVHSSEPGVQQQ